MNIILVATECSPFAKATSLGDLVSTLAKGIEKEGHNVKIFIPRYGLIEPATFYIERIPLELKVKLNDSIITSSIFKGILPNSLTSVFFIESQSHFSNSKEIYPDFSCGEDETGKRNSFFCSAVLESITRLKLSADIIHFFNSECAQIGKFLRSRSLDYSSLNKSKTIFTIESLEGLLDNSTSLAKEVTGFSDFITTSSKAFEDEILLGAPNKEISESLIKKREIFRGIPSSLDDEVYNPELDEDIAQTYSKSYFSIGKKKCKEELLDLFGFDSDAQIPLFGMITRLIQGKGIQILTDILPEIADLNLKFILLGKGEKEVEEQFVEISKKYKNIKIHLETNQDLEKKIYAGSDFYICQREHHPSGGSVLCAMKYGSVPIAFNSGAIKEIVTDIDSSGETNGITFSEYTKEDLFKSIIRARKSYKNKELWTKLIKQVMSFNTANLNMAKNYINCYEIALNAKKSQEASISK